MEQVFSVKTKQNRMDVKYINIIPIMYWFLHSIMVFTIKGFGYFTNIIGCLLLIVCLGMLFVRNYNIVLFYNVITIFYSVTFVVLSTLLFLFFKQPLLHYLIATIIVVLNIFILIIQIKIYGWK